MAIFCLDRTGPLRAEPLPLLADRSFADLLGKSFAHLVIAKHAPCFEKLHVGEEDATTKCGEMLKNSRDIEIQDA